MTARYETLGGAFFANERESIHVWHRDLFRLRLRPSEHVAIDLAARTALGVVNKCERVGAIRCREQVLEPASFAPHYDDDAVVAASIIEHSLEDERDKLRALRTEIIEAHIQRSGHLELSELHAQIPPRAIQEMLMLGADIPTSPQEQLNRIFNLMHAEEGTEILDSTQTGDFTPSQPMRDVGEEPDTLGEEYDTVMQVGEVEQWFRDRREEAAK